MHTPHTSTKHTQTVHTTNPPQVRGELRSVNIHLATVHYRERAGRLNAQHDEMQAVRHMMQVRVGGGGSGLALVGMTISVQPSPTSLAAIPPTDPQALPTDPQPTPPHPPSSAAWRSPMRPRAASAR
jgi:hypothetical protein